MTIYCVIAKQAAVSSYTAIYSSRNVYKRFDQFWLLKEPNERPNSALEEVILTIYQYTDIFAASRLYLCPQVTKIGALQQQVSLFQTLARRGRSQPGGDRQEGGPGGCLSPVKIRW